MAPGDANTVSAQWTNAAEGIHCIEAALEPEFSDDNNGNNRARRHIVVGSAPNDINVVIETPAEGADVNASDTVPVTVLVSDNFGHIVPPCALETLDLQFSGEDTRRVDLRDYFNWTTSRYVYSWRPPTDANGPVCMAVTAESVSILGSILTDTNSICVTVLDDAPPSFVIRCYPASAMIGQVVQIRIDSSEPLMGDQLDSITVTDNDGDPIPLDPCSPEHPSSMRWVYYTEPLPVGTARGTATVQVSGRDVGGRVGNRAGYFGVFDDDLYIYAEDISFSDDNPDVNESITIGVLVHAADNPESVFDVPVTVSAIHPIGGTYQIGLTQYIDEMEPNSSWLVSTNWRNAAIGCYVIEAVLGPDFTDINPSNNEAVRSLYVGPIDGTCWDPNECAGQSYGDATCDGVVNLADLFALKMGWAGDYPWIAPGCCADFNNSGSVDLGDLFILKANFGTSGHTPSTGSQNCPP
jgi:hypothetical protein